MRSGGATDCERERPIRGRRILSGDYPQAIVLRRGALNHPSTAAEKLGVDDTIKRLIQAGVGIPSMEDWLQIFDKVENKANTEELEQEQQEQEEEDADLEADDPNKDASKAERHSASRRLVGEEGGPQRQERQEWQW